MLSYPILLTVSKCSSLLGIMFSEAQPDSEGLLRRQPLERDNGLRTSDQRDHQLDHRALDPDAWRSLVHLLRLVRSVNIRISQTELILTITCKSTLMN